MPFTIEVKADVSAVQAVLKGLPDKLRRKVLRKALEKATKPLPGAVRKLLPKKTGLLRKSITRTTSTSKDLSTITARIGARHLPTEVTRAAEGPPHKHGARTEKADPFYYFHLVVLGVKPHALSKGASLRKKVQSGAMHPGFAGVDALNKAMSAQGGTVAQTFEREVLAGIERELGK